MTDPVTKRMPANIAKIPLDLIIIGAGINGAGIARDASLRGLRTLLLDMDDIGAQTSSWSTRLIHGGLRYLEYAELSLVRESLRERATLLRIAPHLVRPIELLIPIYAHARRGTWTVRAGLTAYDLLSLDSSLGRHRILHPESARRLAPGLNPHGLRAAALYHDAQVEFIERLVLENAIDAYNHGALVITHAPVTRILMKDRAAVGIEFTDALTGESHTAHAPLIINVAGPWVDRVLSSINHASEHPSRRMIGGTRGSHIIVPPFPGAPASAALYTEARADGRPFFIIPWNGLCLIGTTDIRHEADPAAARATPEEIDYLLTETNALFPSAHLGRKDILYTYSGVRPLPYEPGKRPSQITRSHIIRDHADDSPTPTYRLLSIIGGKLTTYRALAEEAVTHALRILDLSDPGCTTAAIPLPGARTATFDHYCRGFHDNFPLPEDVCQRLIRLYGTRAGLVALVAQRTSTLAARLPGATPAIGAEVVHAITSDLAQTVPDILARRMLLSLAPDQGLLALAAVAQIAAAHWPPDHITRGIREYELYCQSHRPAPGA